MDFENWKRQRKWTLANCCIGAFSYGLSTSIYYPTEYYYFRDTMKLKNPDVYYGLSWAFLCGSGIISSLAGSYYADKTLSVREISLYTSLLNVVGNIMYVLYYSPYVVLFGQFLSGTAVARTVAGVGEISRIYNADELTQKIAFLGVATVAGQILGPCLTYPFKLVDTHIGDWKLNINNMPGMVMTAIFLFQFVFNLFTFKNLSKEYNLKREATKGLLCDAASEDENESPETGEKLNENKQYFRTLLRLSGNKHVLFLLVLSFFTSYLRATMSLLQPIKSSYYLKWTQIDLAIFHIVGSLSGGLPTVIAFSALSKLVKDFYFLAYTLAALALALITMALFPIDWGRHTYITQSIFLYGNGIFTLVSGAGFHIVSRSMLACDEMR